MDSAFVVQLPWRATVDRRLDDSEKYRERLDHTELSRWKDKVDARLDSHRDADTDHRRDHAALMESLGRITEQLAGIGTRLAVLADREDKR